MKAENQKMAKLLADLSRNVTTASRKKKAEKAAKSGKAGLTVKQILGNTPSDRERSGQRGSRSINRLSACPGKEMRR